MGIENPKGGEKSWDFTPLELGSGILVAAATAYILLGYAIPAIDAHTAVADMKIKSEFIRTIVDPIRCCARLGAAVIIAATGTGAMWGARRFQDRN